METTQTAERGMEMKKAMVNNRVKHIGRVNSEGMVVAVNTFKTDIGGIDSCLVRCDDGSKYYSNPANLEPADIKIYEWFCKDAKCEGYFTTTTMYKDNCPYCNSKKVERVVLPLR